ncbi:MAG: hypothetical protein A2Y34_08150 [Spirochaetes bacterium GWC1_27_15]|nr:MAG: hypothetical protein A2Z98_04135 [Spirochaetes bacterium GWB1_27_13]OHD20025.1 MAG: hypothetical protein A2Y34_08150 [Spirochaetes bacterium GWC1_27_15]
MIDYFNENGEISFECFLLSFEEENYLIESLGILLNEIGKENIFDYISYCIRELLNNAKKANTKRIYFEDIGLNITNKEEYKKGMKGFKTISSEKLEKYLQSQEQEGLYIRLVSKIENDIFTISVFNNSKIQDEEIKIVTERKKMAREFKTIDEALKLILNNEEGAGLGIIISVLMLKKIGLTSDNYSISFRNNETISSLTIPLSLITEEHLTIINDLLLKEINELPRFPQHILEVQKKIDDPKADIKTISILISKDPGLTAEILRFSNSAIFSLPKKLSSLIEAVKIIGFRGLKNLVYSYGTQVVFSQKYDMSKMQDIWEHSYKVGFFAFHLAKKYSLREDLEDIYIGGILHDLGKILTFSINANLVEKMNDICHEKNIPIRIIEEISSGYNHSVIGGVIAKKWNFPEKIIAAIENHHTPWETNEKYKSYMYCIYLANMISYPEANTEHFYNQIDSRILEFFEIENFIQYTELITQLSNYLAIQKKQ